MRPRRRIPIRGATRRPRRLPDLGEFIVADSAPPRQRDRAFAAGVDGTMLTVQTCAGFTLTLVTIHMLPFVVSTGSWRYAFAPLALGPFFGVWAMARLRTFRSRPGWLTAVAEAEGRPLRQGRARRASGRGQDLPQLLHQLAIADVVARGVGFLHLPEDAPRLGQLSRAGTGPGRRRRLAGVSAAPPAAARPAPAPPAAVPARRQPPGPRRRPGCRPIRPGGRPASAGRTPPAPASECRSVRPRCRWARRPPAGRRPAA